MFFCIVFSHTSSSMHCISSHAALYCLILLCCLPSSSCSVSPDHFRVIFPHPSRVFFLSSCLPSRILFPPVFSPFTIHVLCFLLPSTYLVSLISGIGFSRLFHRSARPEVRGTADLDGGA